jgi:hypothetical protein
MNTGVGSIIQPLTQSSKRKCGLNVFFGGNLVSFTGQRCTIFSIAGNDVLWVEKSETGLLISARLFDSDKKIMAEIEKNNVTVNPTNIFKRDIKKHTLVVVGQSDQEVLNVDFLNSHSVVINGIFPWEGHGQVVVDKAKIAFPKDNTMAGGFTDCGRGIAFTLTADGEFAFH